ncbi:hypothetical protein STCU_04625 [Strigomonas culicis]|uniref:Leucine-rich repeat protein (LRRP) n=1 Tax=Strigomonas culicis TaxID=28005 RepID=S9W061_9TRYP|nr:hypothetical protein STCU_04625 [Strigomonas culicis]|eukprot:EPY29300.1 hypothetical protein STCU_04625 [Strigomonas culicis]
MQHPSGLRKLCLSGNDLFNTFQRSGLSHFYVARYLQQSNNASGGAAAAWHSNPHANTGAFYEEGVNSDSVNGAPLPSGALLSTLANDRTLTQLELDDCGLQGACLALLCRSLMLNQGLLVLSLRNNNIDAEGATLIGRALCRHGALQRLYISGNVLEDEGVCALAAVLEDTSRQADGMGSPEASVSVGRRNKPADGPGACPLEVLDVEKTWMGDRGLVALGVALQTNHSLRVLLLDDNHFTAQGCEAFAAFMEKNESVRKCQLGATSASHPILLRIERATLRNTRKAENSESDALQREVVRLHYQKYKLQEARVELEGLRDKTVEVKQAAANVDLQFKQDTSDYTKKITELKEQIEHYTKQEESYKVQGAQLEEELKRQQVQFEEDMQVVQERLTAEMALREQMEERFKECEAELARWQNEGPEREAERRAHLQNLKEDMAQWGEQRRTYKAETDELQALVHTLEDQLESRRKAAMPTPATREGASNAGKKNRKDSFVSSTNTPRKAAAAKQKA